MKGKEILSELASHTEGIFRDIFNVGVLVEDMWIRRILIGRKINCKGGLEIFKQVDLLKWEREELQKCLMIIRKVEKGKFLSHETTVKIQKGLRTKLIKLE